MTYSQSLTMAQKRYSKRGQNAHRYREEARSLGPISNTVILIILACLLGLLYLTQVTKTNAYGYQINDLKLKQQQLESEQADLQIASARLQSLNRVESSSVAQAMVPATPAATVKE